MITAQPHYLIQDGVTAVEPFVYEGYRLNRVGEGIPVLSLMLWGNANGATVRLQLRPAGTTIPFTTLTNDEGVERVWDGQGFFNFKLTGHWEVRATASGPVGSDFNFIIN